MTDFLVDNSAWDRLVAGDAAVTARLREIAASPTDLIVTCPPQVLEFCRRACTPEEFDRRRALVTLGFPVETAPDDDLVLDVQAAVREVVATTEATVSDILVACFALANDATVLCTTPVFARIAGVTALRQECVGKECDGADGA